MSSPAHTRLRHALSGLLALAATTAGAANPEPWTPARIASTKFESHAAFDPVTHEFYFVRSNPDFLGWRLFVTHCTRHGWSKPKPPAFAGDGVEADPWFTPDGKSLYFISTRSSDGVFRADLDIWVTDRIEGNRWQSPRRLPAPVNSEAQEWFPRLASDGWLYFGSARPGGFGKNDIWRAQREGDDWRVENAGPAFNTAGQEYEVEFSPDGTQAILMADDRFHVLTWADGAWQPRQLFATIVNAGEVIGAKYSPSGRSLLYSRDLHDARSGEFFIWRIQGEESWPPDCQQK
jgi:hypothetical protein